MRERSESTKQKRVITDDFELLQRRVYPHFHFQHFVSLFQKPKAQVFSFDFMTNDIVSCCHEQCWKSPKL